MMVTSNQPATKRRKMQDDYGEVCEEQNAILIRIGGKWMHINDTKDIIHKGMPADPVLKELYGVNTSESLFIYEQLLNKSKEPKN
ncbi:hypothetical protein ACLKA6_002615 [Drosophila palustris]